MPTDEELKALAESAVNPDYGPPIPPQPGAGTGQTLGLDLSAFPAPQEPAPLPTTAPNAPENVNSEAPLPEDPNAQSIDDFQAKMPGQPVAAPVPNAALSAEGGVEALQQARAAGQGVAEAKAAEAPAKAAAAEGNAQATENTALESRVNADEIEIQQKAAEVGRAKAQAIADDAQQKFAQFKFHDFWADKSAPEQFKARLFMALGEFSRDKGGPNRNVQQINDLIEQQHKRDVGELGKLHSFAELKTKGVEQYMADRKAAMAVLQLKHAALYQAAELEAKAQLMRNGIPVEEAENNTLVQQMRAKAEAEYAKGYGDLVKDQAQLEMAKAHLAISRGQLEVARKNSGKAEVPTATEGDNAARGRNMALGLDQFEKSGMSDYVPPDDAQQKWFSNKEQIDAAAERNKSAAGQAVNFAMRKLGQIPKNDLEGLSPKDSEYFATFGRVVEPYARKQSGAAISAPEWKSFASQLGLGQSGQNGRALREQAARDMQTLGGRATKQLEESDRSRGVESPGSKSIKQPSKVGPKSITDFASKYGL